MASATQTTPGLCATCNKAKGIFKCEGCSRSFCPKDSISHRTELDKQLEELVVVHDELLQHTKEPQSHPLLNKINEWETESIRRIRQMADEVRNDLVSSATQQFTVVKEKLQLVSGELRKSQEENDFSEIDLRQWTQKLEALRKELLHPTTAGIREDSIPLVGKIRLERYATFEVFERACDSIQIQDGGYLAVKDNTSGHTQIRGKHQYHTGRHILRFEVEKLAQDGWIFFGVVSQSQAMQSSSYSSPSCYGWSNKNQVFQAGQLLTGQSCEIIQGDLIELTIDCDERQITLRNERLHRTQQLSIDTGKYPFPWQLHLNLHAPNTAVRILSSTN